MEKIFVKKRETVGKKTKRLRDKNFIPAILYGKSTDPILLMINKKDFLKIYKKTGLSSIAELNIEKKKHLVLVHSTQKNAISDEIIHIDFYQPQLKEKIVIEVPITFEGEAPAVKEFNGTFVSNIKEIGVRGFSLDFPHDIKVDISVLKTFNDHITVNDLKISEKLEILQDKNFVIASVLPPQDVDAELKKEIGDVESVEVAESKKDKKIEERERDKDGEG